MHPERFDSLAAEAGQLPRRAVLGSAAAGIGLTVASLFTSVGLDEAAAGGKSKRKKRRARRRRKNNGKNPPAGFTAVNVRLVTENLTANPLYFKGFIFDDYRRCLTKDLQTIDPNSAQTFAPGYYMTFGLILDQDGMQYSFGGYDQDPLDGFPAVEIMHGGTMTKDRCRVGFKDDVLQHELNVGMSLEKTVQKFRFVVKRENDTENERLFRFQVYDAP